MNMQTTAPAPSIGNFAHPSWCDPRYCGRSNPTPCHLSAPRRIGGDPIGSLVITTQLTCQIEESLDQAPVSIELVMRDPVTGKAGRFLLERESAAHFHESLGELLPRMS
jgi:hypothetical protein